MKRLYVAVLDYGIGNQAAVRRLILKLGHRCTITQDRTDIERADLVILPGVGAFPAAMESLHRLDLIEPLHERSRNGQAVLGICLGMQLLAESSEEMELTAGVGLIPGKIRALEVPRWHIGWNAVEVTATDMALRAVDGDSFYFNHSFTFDAPPEYVVGIARVGRPLVAAVRRGSVLGVQFHPEKSQMSGRRLMAAVISGIQASC